MAGHGAGIAGHLARARVGEHWRQTLGVLVGAAHQDAVVVAALRVHGLSLTSHGAGVAGSLPSTFRVGLPVATEGFASDARESR